MKVFRVLFGILLLSSVLTSIQAQETDCTVRKTYPSKDGTYLCVTNKFGDINIITSEDDLTSVCAKITISQDDKELSEKCLSFIKINIDKTQDTINIRTVFDERFFQASYRKGRSGFSVDYAIYVPANTNLSVYNSFGDIAIDEINGFVNVKLYNGDFSASRLTRGNIKPISTLYFEHAKAEISEANWLSVNAKHCQSIEIGEAKALLVTSEFSKLHITDISSIVCDSKSDYYEITSLKNLIAESSYSEFEIEKFSGQLRAITKFGTISVAEVGNDFSLIDLNCTHTPVELWTQEGISYKSDIAVTNTLLDFPYEEYPRISRSRNDNTIVLTGVAGKNKETQSLIKIRADFGTLEIK